MAENWKCVNSRVIQCSFLAKDDQTYIVSVINTDITQAKFIITYYSYGDCLNYPLNSPLFVVLTAR